MDVCQFKIKLTNHLPFEKRGGVHAHHDCELFEEESDSVPINKLNGV